MRLDEIIKYLKMKEYKDLNYKLLSQEECKKLVFYIEYLERYVRLCYEKGYIK